MVELAKKVLEWRRAGLRVALSVVVGAWGSSPRPAGSFMAVAEDGGIAGSVSGGCVEGSILEISQEVIATQKPLLTRFGSAADKPWEVGAPCGGDVEILTFPYDDEVHGLMMDRAAEGLSFTFVYCLDGVARSDGDSSSAECVRGLPFFEGAQAVVCDGCQESQWMDALLLDEVLAHFSEAEKNVPKVGRFGLRESHAVRAATIEACGTRMFCCSHKSHPKIVCVGAVHIAQAMIPIAKTAGYDVIIVDPRRSFVDETRFGGARKVVVGWPQNVFPLLHLDENTAVCALTHDPKLDVPAMDEALKSNAFYVGCLGHAETLLDRAAELRSRGRTEDELSRVYGPIGLWIGGRDPGEIALSAVAQMQAVRYGRIGHADTMPGNTLDFFTEESVARIAAARETEE